MSSNICSKCNVHQVMHSVGGKRLCCGCYVLSGNPPAGWHGICVATYHGMRTELNRAAWTASEQPEQPAAVDRPEAPSPSFPLRLVFLDFWGTLNEPGGRSDLSRKNVGKILERLVYPLGARVVITSDSAKRWDTAPEEHRPYDSGDGRHGAIELLCAAGMPRERILGCTDQRWDSVVVYDRVTEISAFLHETGLVASFVVLDDALLPLDEDLRRRFSRDGPFASRLPRLDDPMVQEIGRRFVRVDPTTCLTDADVEKARQILEKDLPRELRMKMAKRFESVFRSTPENGSA